MSKISRTAALVAAGLTVSFPVWAADLPSAKPEAEGFSPARLARLVPWFQAEVDGGRIPGAVLLVARNGRVVLNEAVGYRDREAQAPMPADAVFRIASMTKPFTSVAIMMLVEQGRIALQDPVSRYLPEFRNETVGTDRVPVQREMTVHDLLRHTAGLTYSAAPDAKDADPVQVMYREAKVAERDQTLEQFIAKIAAQPLMYQPGTHWEYSHSVDVLGRIVEVVSGIDLNSFVVDNIAKPLGLRDTAYWAPESAAGRAAFPQVDPVTQKKQAVPNPTARPAWFSGGGGMVSTAADYARFCQMLLNGGELDGVRILGPKTVALMTQDHLPPGTQYSADLFKRFGGLAPSPVMGQGFGLGFAVRTNEGRNPSLGSVGDYAWGGAYGTYFWVDPKEKLFAVMMLQGPSDRLHYRYAMRDLVYQALQAPAHGAPVGQ